MYFWGTWGKGSFNLFQKNIINFFKEFLIDDTDTEKNLINLFKVIDDQFNTAFYNLIGSKACIVYFTKENSKNVFIALISAIHGVFW